jgi:hypothetical protein
MTTNKSEINVTDLDFDLIKQNLIEYFKADPTFSDYEFEGSALNILLDILSYNTHLNAVMANMSVNEMFIDSAQLRQSIVSIAKALGYTPRSVRTSMANIALEFTNISGAPAYITMPAGTRFSTPQGLVYSTKEQILIYPSVGDGAGVYRIDSVDIYEGVYNNFQYTVNYSDIDQKFVIPSVNADISSLIVTVIENNVPTIYSLSENITLLDPTSTVYFLHETSTGRFEVTFGDGIIGRKPINNAVIQFSYIITSAAEEANGIEVFKQYQQIDGFSSYTITTNTKSYGGAPAESKEEIQKLAPLIFKAQNRAVVTEDYKNFLLSEYPFIDTMSIWGGEYNNPPIYGKVFFAIKPEHTEFLSNNLKEKIKQEFIRKYNVVTVIPEIVDPDYTYILYDASIKYDYNKTTLTKTQLEISSKQNLIEFFENTTEKFNKPFYFSSSVNVISDTDESIMSVLADVTLMKRGYPTLGDPFIRSFSFNSAIKPGSLYSSIYNPGGIDGIQQQILFDNGNGVIGTKNATSKEIINNNVGNINYVTGLLNINIIAYSLPSDTNDIRIYCEPVIKNVYPDFNQILVVDDSPFSDDFGRPQGIKITALVEDFDKKY